MSDTYRSVCHFDGCETRFVGVDRDGYVDHIREAHGSFKARIYDELVVEEDP